MGLRLGFAPILSGKQTKASTFFFGPPTQELRFVASFWSETSHFCYFCVGLGKCVNKARNRMGRVQLDLRLACALVVVYLGSVHFWFGAGKATAALLTYHQLLRHTPWVPARGYRSSEWVSSMGRAKAPVGGTSCRSRLLQMGLGPK